MADEAAQFGGRERDGRGRSGEETPDRTTGGASDRTSDRTSDGTSDGTWDDLVLDEDFVRAAETSEPSARARMLAARWRNEEPEPQPWRSDEPPAGWFFSKARRRRWRRR